MSGGPSRRLARFLRTLSNWVRAAKTSAPLVERSCPICGYHGYFKARGTPLRLDAKCTGCGSSERHRLFWLALEADAILPDTEGEPTILHFAPDPVLAGRFRERFGGYTTADLFEKADRRLDIEAMELDDDSVDVVIASHILEHVDDRKACAEIRRVLRPGGRLIAMVPLVEGWARSYEPAGIEGAEARLVHFGQSDHVRYFGADFRDRVKGSGLRAVAEHSAEGDAVIRHGLLRGEKVFVFEK